MQTTSESDIWDALKDTDQDPGNSNTNTNNVILLYTGHSQSKAPTAAAWQGNRNPFVDHPEYADGIWN